MSDSREALPALRRYDVQLLPPEEDGQQRFLLYDPSGATDASLALTGPGYFIAMHLDGRHTIDDVAAAFEEYFGAQLPHDRVAELIDALDQSLLLRNERSAAHVAERVREYRARPARDNRERWPAAGALRGELDATLAAGRQPPVENLCGLIAPHLDYERGRPCYADAYAVLRQAPARRYVILGTNHFGGSTATVATSKDFQTPLGLAATDRDLLTRLESRVGSLCGDEFDHEREHSIELQVHLLQHISPEPFEMLALLIPDPTGPTGTRPLLDDGPDLNDVITALREELAADATPTVVIASADLSHVGMSFGEIEPTTDAFLEQVGASDRQYLDLLATRREDDFVAAVRKNENATRICSVGNLWTLLKLFPEAGLRILRYHQAVDRPGETHVTCAAGVLTKS